MFYQSPKIVYSPCYNHVLSHHIAVNLQNLQTPSFIHNSHVVSLALLTLLRNTAYDF